MRVGASCRMHSPSPRGPKTVVKDAGKYPPKNGGVEKVGRGGFVG